MIHVTQKIGVSVQLSKRILLIDCPKAIQMLLVYNHVLLIWLNSQMFVKFIFYVLKPLKTMKQLEPVIRLRFIVPLFIDSNRGQPHPGDNEQLDDISFALHVSKSKLTWNHSFLEQERRKSKFWSGVGGSQHIGHQEAKNKNLDNYGGREAMSPLESFRHRMLTILTYVQLRYSGSLIPTFLMAARQSGITRCMKGLKGKGRCTDFFLHKLLEKA